ncbi:hypothetical protein DdX_17385 [Ditylenchus destructor]|uniref:Uncharacterized protein n=1 Tax=Ditylenchus destructor TaxID=166010 RepID=A0AAD4MNQ5_9BILA|nr:hypothetical protein DdX_17385 [Ditylenchus destructor]
MATATTPSGSANDAAAANANSAAQKLNLFPGLSATRTALQDGHLSIAEIEGPRTGLPAKLSLGKLKILLCFGERRSMYKVCSGDGPGERH